jgi:endonuclease YncB( thermonuclease family)
MQMSEWTWPGSTATRIIDGDTLVARLTRDIGFNGSVTFNQKLRLHRIDAYKVNTPKGLAARERVINLAWTGPVAISAGLPILLNIITVKPYKYGDEWMAEVHLPDGRSLNELLVSEGLAVWWDGRGKAPAVEST